MRKALLTLSVLFATSYVNAATLHEPDAEFITNSKQVGISQANWDHGQSAKLTMQNAYKFTYSQEMENGPFIHDLSKATGFDLSKAQGYDADGPHSLDIIIRDRLNQESLIILKNGKLVDEFYWNGMNKDKTHLQMSITKSFTSMTLAQLVDEGKVDMQDPIVKYLPELKSAPGYAGATVQQVADMRSGIKINFTPGKIWDERMTNVQEWNGVNKYPELKSILDFGATLNKRSDFNHGQAYDYQCVNTEMLGMIVARVTGKSLAENMEQRLWKKVGFEHNARIQSNSHGEAVGSGGLNATGRDVALMMDVLVNGGKNRQGEQILPTSFIDNLLAGNDEVRSAWKNGAESKLAPDAWYKDQIRVFNIEGHKFLAFVGIHGQVTVGEPTTGIVIHMNGAQDEMQATRTVAMTFLNVIPTLLSEVNKQK
ncbi:beta-lactamase family protein [Shewanella schlegeliana]|uniref:Serine hydrolase n=1 Tax=Shewanella schlegeliana TaxID=190308 RepID=A0ABS1T3B4_9GAMM|nr:serine hydrolase [Shewanella schlegeliana]MBL4914312.1 serine hydrolase [Shewanella schlegeliana]MCL1109465.1 beta-lactamase family protein [Shewanella schlegeliana]GIU37351.1 hypothetical protein TUM4433_37500 [Shewanella schlegeliana]